MSKMPKVVELSGKGAFGCLYLVPDRKLLFFLPLIAGRQAQIIILEILNVFLWL